MIELKPGYKTSEFMVTALVVVGSFATSLSDAKVFSPKWAAILSAISAGAYLALRTFLKVNVANCNRPKRENDNEKKS